MQYKNNIFIQMGFGWFGFSYFPPFPYNKILPPLPPPPTPHLLPPIPPWFQFTATPYHSALQAPEYCFDFGIREKRWGGIKGVGIKGGVRAGDRPVSSINKARARSYWLSWGLRPGEQPHHEGQEKAMLQLSCCSSPLQHGAQVDDGDDGGEGGQLVHIITHLLDLYHN